MTHSSQVERFERFCALVGLRLEPFQIEIARAIFGPQREVLILLPRGQGKTTLCAAVSLFHLLTEPNPAAYCAAASRDQARILFEAARTLAAHPLIAPKVTARHLELRVPNGHLRVLAAEGPRQHGLTPSIAFVDELHAHSNGELFEALQTALLKRPGSKLVTISTAGSGSESPLGRLRARALALPEVERRGFVTDARGPTLRMLEWAVPDTEDVDDPGIVKRANPAPWITAEGLRDQREAVQDRAFRRFHCNQITLDDRSWLPPGAWQSCAGDAHIEPGEPIWVGCDLGGERSASALMIVSSDLRIAAHIYQGNEGVLRVRDKARELAETYAVREFVFDPFSASQLAAELAEERIQVVAFPQSSSRMGPASERLYKAVIEKRLTHPNDPVLNIHVANAIARDTPRGWRLDKATRTSQIDAVIALAMAVERVEARTGAVELLGWL